MGLCLRLWLDTRPLCVCVCVFRDSHAPLSLLAPSVPTPRHVNMDAQEEAPLDVAPAAREGDQSAVVAGEPDSVLDKRQRQTID